MLAGLAGLRAPEGLGAAPERISAPTARPRLPGPPAWAVERELAGAPGAEGPGLAGRARQSPVAHPLRPAPGLGGGPGRVHRPGPWSRAGRTPRSSTAEFPCRGPGGFAAPNLVGRREAGRGVCGPPNRPGSRSAANKPDFQETREGLRGVRAGGPTSVLFCFLTAAGETGWFLLGDPQSERPLSAASVGAAGPDAPGGRQTSPHGRLPGRPCSPCPFLQTSGR